MATINLTAFPEEKTFSCPKCSVGIRLIDPQGCEYVVCVNCNSYIRYVESSSPFVMEDAPIPAEVALLKLYSRFRWKELDFVVIGYIEKKEAGNDYRWKEYMLYNFKKGYAFLAEFNGHWNFIAGSGLYPELKTLSRGGTRISHGGLAYRIYNRYQSQITGLLGEFDWNILHEEVKAKEYISPPLMLVQETSNYSGYSADFYKGEYTQPEDLAAAAQLPIRDFPEMIGIGANEPSPYASRWNGVFQITLFVMLGFVLVGLALTLIRPQKVVLSQQLLLRPVHPPDSLWLNAADTSTNIEFQPVRSESFTLDNRTPLEFSVTSNADNNWTEATMVLANEADNQTWEVSQAIEYYHGYEDGEDWSEGSLTEKVLLSSIPAGRYHLNVFPVAGTRKLDYLEISVTENITLWRNLFVTMGLLALYPLYCGLRKYWFERARWRNSDFSPYQSKEDD